MPDAPLSICLLAGEPSGDLLGARLMAALKQQSPRLLKFSGVGGMRMAGQGLDSLFPMEKLSVMGVAEILPRLPDLLSRIRQTAVFIAESKPDILVTIDSPDFVFRVIRRLRGLTTHRPRLIHYVAPSVWAWRPERAAKLAQLYDGVLCLLPFEPPYFERAGMQASFCGHPLLEDGLGQGLRDAGRHALGIRTDEPLVGLFFGSRQGELKRVGPALYGAAMHLHKARPDVHFVAPTLPHLAPRLKDMLRGAPFPWKVVVPGEDRADLFAALDSALATSGTVGLELALAGVPHAIGYRLSRPTYAMVRRRITVKYAHLVNLLLDRPAVPEFIQTDCTAGALGRVVEDLMTNDRVKLEQHAAFREARLMLAGERPEEAPSVQAAKFILGYEFNQDRSPIPT